MTETATIAYSTPFDHAVITSAQEAIDRSLRLLREPYWPREWFRRPTEAELDERRSAGRQAEHEAGLAVTPPAT